MIALPDPRAGPTLPHSGASASPILSALRVASPRVVVVAALAMVGIVFGLDLAIGPEISTSIIYVVPIGGAAWYAGQRSGVLVSAVSATSWIAADLGSGIEYSHPAIAVWNTFVRLGLFLIVTLLLVRLHRALDAAEESADTDHLTGLANPRHLAVRLGEEIARHRRTQRAFSLAYVDLDNFKSINDRWGHAVGDEALIVVARSLRRTLRSTDVPVRLGGDEFALLLPETDLESAVTVCAKAERSLNRSMSAHGWPVTFSIGAITFVGAPESTQAAITLADDLMYSVKKDGKAAVVHRTWPPLHP